MISLRPVESDDIEIFYEHQADPVGSAMAAFPSRDHAAHVEHWTKRVLGNPANGVRTVLVDGAVAGNVVSWLDEEGRRMLGYWIGREFWGQGVATEAVRLYLAELPAPPIYADVASTNIGSQRVLEKNGFVRTGHSEIADDGVELLLFVLN